MTSVEGNRQPNLPPSDPARPRFQRSLIQGMAVIVFVVGGIWATLWWQERPIRVAADLLDQKNLRGAKEAVDEFLREHPDHQGALALQARVLVEEGRPKQAIDIFERVGASEPQDLHAWAKALLQLEQWSYALPLLEYVEKSGIDRADVLHELAACRAKVGDFDNALKAADEFARQPGFEARGELLKGTLHHERGNMRLTASAWAIVFKLAPDALDLQIPPAEFFLEYGRVLLALGEPALAEGLISRSLKLKPSPSAQVSLGEAQFQLGKAAEARQSFETAMAGDPYSVAARKGLATLVLADGKPEKAVELLLPLERTPALTSEIAFLLQRGYVRLGDEPAAKRWREKADELRIEENVNSAVDQVLRDTPNSDWARVIRAYKYARLGNWNEAETLLKTMDEQARTQPFIRDLCTAVKSHGELPSLQGLPIRDR